MNFLNMDYRRLAWIDRWTILRRIKKQNVAEHSYFVTLYVLEISNYIGLKVSNNFTMHCLLHDMGEIVTGDIQRPYKKEIKSTYGIKLDVNLPTGLSPLSYEEKKVLKIADLFEAAMFCKEEISIGNKCMNKILIDYVKDLEEICDHNLFHKLMEKLNDDV